MLPLGVSRQRDQRKEYGQVFRSDPLAAKFLHDARVLLHVSRRNAACFLVDQLRQVPLNILIRDKASLIKIRQDSFSRSGCRVLGLKEGQLFFIFIIRRPNRIIFFLVFFKRPWQGLGDKLHEAGSRAIRPGQFKGINPILCTRHSPPLWIVDQIQQREAELIGVGYFNFFEQRRHVLSAFPGAVFLCHRAFP